MKVALGKNFNTDWSGLDALKQAGFASELARCPVKGTIGGTNWYRLQSASTNPGVLSIQLLVQRQADKAMLIARLG